MTRPAPVPLLSGPDEVTVEWVESVLVGAGLVPGVGRLSSVRGAPVGTGKVGDVIRYRLEWQPPFEGPASVIVKFASPDETSRQAGLLTGTYTREVGFYRSLATTLQCRVPDCYGVELDPSTGEFVIVLEDLAGARTGDQIAGCTVDEAAIALEALSGLHAPHWGASTLADQPWLGVRGQDGGAGLGMLYDVLVDGFVARYDSRLPAETLDAALRMKGRVPAWIALDTEPFTLIHGDYRLDNLMFCEAHDANRDVEVAVVDWQTPSIGPALSDVAYFLGAGLSVSDRREHERELVELYCRALAARGIALEPSRGFDDYRAHSFAGLHMAVVASQLVGRDERGDEMFAVMAERHASHVIDLDAFELLG